MISLCNKLSDLQNESQEEEKKKSGKWRGRHGEGMGIRPLKTGRKDVLWNYLCFLNPLLSTPSLPETNKKKKMYLTYVPSLSDTDFVCAIADV